MSLLEEKHKYVYLWKKVTESDYLKICPEIALKYFLEINVVLYEKKNSS
jgi:hypothetical protein